MNKNEVIEKGLIEQYLLGELEGEELQQLESLIDGDQELAAYKARIEEDLERLAIENSIVPPASAKTDLFSSLAQNRSNAREISFGNNHRNNSSVYTLVAAGISLLLVAAALFFYTQWQDAKDQMLGMSGDLTTIRSQMDVLQKDLESSQRKLDLVSDPDVDRYILKGNNKSPGSAAIAYINRKSEEIYLNSGDLAELPENTTYQLWADVDGIMIDMGIVKTGNELQAMKYIPEAESLNLTIEPEGGSDHPTVENLVANIYL